jgi:uncharacterized protein (TIRG00374 family)
VERKRLIITSVVVVVLAALIWYQAHTFKKFDWTSFAQATAQVNWWLVLAAVGVVYLADGLRAWRWAIFLNRGVNPFHLLAAQYIGFAGLALLGRPGEFIRPYVVARRTRLSFPSQIAVWAVERIFDTTAVALIFGIDVLVAGTLRTFPQYGAIRKGGFALLGIVAFFVVAAYLVWRHGPQWARRLEGEHHPPHIRHRIAFRIRNFGEGLHTIHGIGSFLTVSGLSLLIWMLIAASYWLVLHSYSDPELTTLTMTHAIVLMGGSVAGGVLQLPVVGGGSQLVTINLLLYLFAVNPDQPELATSCGILLWLVTFMSVIPLGLLLARKEHLSLRKITEESARQEQKL